MPFPSDLEALLAAGYSHLRMEQCPACSEWVDVFSTPAKREMALNSMCHLGAAALRHVQTCGKPVEPEPETPLPMYGVSDPNRQLLSVGYEPDGGILVCQFKTAKWAYMGVPEEEYLKLRKSPYAYRIFTLNIKGKYDSTKL